LPSLTYAIPRKNTGPMLVLPLSQVPDLAQVLGCPDLHTHRVAISNDRVSIPPLAGLTTCFVRIKHFGFLADRNPLHPSYPGTSRRETDLVSTVSRKQGDIACHIPYFDPVRLTNWKEGSQRGCPLRGV